MANIKLCVICVKFREDPTFRNPRHLVHPADQTHMLFDVRGEAICPICQAKWHRHRNEAVLVIN
jgi:hypothetical protein